MLAVIELFIKHLGVLIRDILAHSVRSHCGRKFDHSEIK